jgi:hypothetical protein
MQPTLVREPFHRDGWVYEDKVDGWRIIAYKDGYRVRLVSSHRVYHTNRFADVAAAIARLSARTLVLDGEVAIYDQQVRSRFEWLREPDPDAVASPPLYKAFDVIYRDERDRTAQPLRDRRARLQDVGGGSELVSPVRRLALDDREAWAQVVERGYEGVRRQGRDHGVRGRTDEALIEGEAERLGRRGGPMAAAHRHWRESLPSSRSGARGRVIQPAARARRFCCFFLNAARLRAVFRLRFFSRMASLLSDLGAAPMPVCRSY